MILHRFCSQTEFDRYLAGETLINEKDHGAERGYDITTAVGFCFFVGDPEEAKHRLSGIVDFDVCLTVDVSHTKVRLCHGRYAEWCNGVPIGTAKYIEFCATAINIHDFKLVSADTSFSGYAPNGTTLRALFPEFFRL